MKETKWIIWSIEHNAWWGPNRLGYVQDRKLAGIYSFHQACKIVKGANIMMNNIPNEAMVQFFENKK